MARNFRLRKVSSGIGLAWARTDRTADTIVRYANCFGAVRGPLLFVLSIVWRPSRGRLIEAAAADAGAKLLVRLGTSDISVFNGIYCWREYDWELQGSPRVIVDAGAYTGLSTAYFATRYPDAQIIAIEPSDTNFAVLVRNTATFGNVHPVHAALWAHTGSVIMTDPGCGAWGLQIQENAALPSSNNAEFSSNAMHSVDAVTIADVIRGFGLNKIDLLKLDIEGSEKEVFSDCGSWIGQVDAICMELHDRFKAGCSRSFFKAIDEFPTEIWHGENVLVIRKESSLAPGQATANQPVQASA